MKLLNLKCANLILEGYVLRGSYEEDYGIKQILDWQRVSWLWIQDKKNTEVYLYATRKAFFPEPGPAGRLHETQAVFVGASEEEATKRKRFCDNFTMGTSSDIRNGEWKLCVLRGTNILVYTQPILDDFDQVGYNS